MAAFEGTDRASKAIHVAVPSSRLYSGPPPAVAAMKFEATTIGTFSGSPALPEPLPALTARVVLGLWI